MAIYNAFKYPQFPSHLPPLDNLSERLISSRLGTFHADQNIKTCQRSISNFRANH